VDGRAGTSGTSDGASTPEAAARSDQAPAGEPETDELLRATAAAYESLRSLRADFVQRLENPLLGKETTTRGTLFQRRPDRFLLRFSEPEGDIIVSDGRSIWVYYPSIDPEQVVRADASPGGAGAIDLQAQFVGDPVERFRAERHPSERVAGREAYVVTLTPRRPAGYESLKVWIDARDHLVRRFVIRERSGLVRRFELRALELNPALPDRLFEFEPPPGATIVERG
ncbi:MAG: LolA family protein, partial [Longimicrobiales bacterium]